MMGNSSTVQTLTLFLTTTTNRKEGPNRGADQGTQGHGVGQGLRTDIRRKRSEHDQEAVQQIQIMIGKTEKGENFENYSIDYRII